ADALVGLAELRRRQGRVDEARSLLERAGGPGGAPLSRAALAMDSGDPVSAAELAARFLRHVPQESKADRTAALELLVRAHAARGDLERAASALAELREIERIFGTRPLRAAVRLADGIVAAASGDHERARPLLEDAVDLFHQSGAPFETAQARIELATSLMALGRMDAAGTEARAALDALRELGAGREAERARRLLEVLSSTDRRTRLPELTRRETEVLRLVAEGLTNARIAQRLVVSEHTVHRHVTNILRKLDLPSRTAAAAHAVRLSLLEAPPR
ncbi:MAG: LuxR C-terminal-related transcriptional regulator, partial [bacterium]